MHKQSLFHISKRDALPWYQRVLIRGGAILLALIVCALVTMLLTGENPISIYGTIFYGAFGTARKSWVTFQNLAVLLGISLAVTPAFKMRFWNIGAEGQVLIGCLATAACMICLGDKLPSGVLILVMLAAALAAGALWGFLPSFFKATARSTSLPTARFPSASTSLCAEATCSSSSPPASPSTTTLWSCSS